MTESFEDMVERIAKAWKEEPCPPEEGPGCDPDLHNWDTAHPGDKQFALDTVRFVLREAGLG
jgi:hypothetical protein